MFFMGSDNRNGSEIILEKIARNLQNNGDYRKIYWKIALKRGVPRQDIPDLIQEHYLKIYENGMKNYKYPLDESTSIFDEYLKGYLTVSFHYLITDYFRSRAQGIPGRTFCLEEKDFSVELSRLSYEEYLKQQKRQAELTLVDKKVERILTALPKVKSEKYKRVLKLRAEGDKYYEIAKKLGIPEGSVKSRLHYAKETLLKLMSA